MKTICSEHSGCEARIQHLETTVALMKEDLSTMRDNLEKKVNKIFMMVITVLLGLVANLSIIIAKGV